MANGSHPAGEGRRSPSPPPYNIAVARVAGGMATRVDTSVVDEVETHFGPEPVADDIPEDGRNEAPPGYSAVEPGGC